MKRYRRIAGIALSAICVVSALSLNGCDRTGTASAPETEILADTTDFSDESVETGQSDALTETEMSTEEEESAEAERLPDADYDGFSHLTVDPDDEHTGPGVHDPSFRGKDVQNRIVIATDIHYLADQLADGRCESFMRMAEQGDGRVLTRLWEITDAFFEQIMEMKPDVLILSGDLTMEGEQLSHQELAEKLGSLEDAGIQVLVIPGNHDINNPSAKGYEENSIYPVLGITGPEFARIYGEFGYDEAEERDAYSLSYVYRLDEYFQFLMLDSCQYDPVNMVGGALPNETYDWVQDVLDQAWEEGIRTIPVTHHNLFDQSGVSRAFFDNCTIMHDEKLIEMFEDNDINLHLSGHLHIQHYREENGICEIVTGSLLMEPFQYGVIDILRDGDIHYYNQTVDGEFGEYGRDFMRRVCYGKAFRELSQRVENGDIWLTDEEMVKMASYYAVLCENYYAGTMYKIIDQAKEDPAYDYWMDIDFITETSSFLDNILDDPAYNYRDVLIKY